MSFIEEKQQISWFVTDACRFTAAFILFGINVLVNNLKIKSKRIYKEIKKNFKRKNRGFEFSSYETKLLNRATLNDVTL